MHVIDIVCFRASVSVKEVGKKKVPMIFHALKMILSSVDRQSFSPVPISCLTKWPFFFTSWSLSMQRVVCELQAQTTDCILFFNSFKLLWSQWVYSISLLVFPIVVPFDSLHLFVFSYATVTGIIRRSWREMSP